MAKKYLKCPNCGAGNPDGAISCGKCGAKLEIAAPRRCVRCDSPIPFDAMICPHCGRDYSTVLQVTTTSTTEGHIAEPLTTEIRRATPTRVHIAAVLVLAAILILSNLGWFYLANLDSVRYDELNQDYDAILDDYHSMLENYNDMLQDRDALDYDLMVYETFRLDSTVADFYECVREANGILTGESWVLDSSLQEMADFGADLSMHDQGKLSWPLQEELYYNYYGTHSYDDAKIRMNFLLTMAGVAAGDSSVDRVGKILECVRGFVSGRMDMTERFYAPWETLAHRSGDCEDLSILTSALFELAGIDSAFGAFTNDYNENHAMVLIHLNDLGPYDYYSYDDLTSLGLSSGRWIIIEPQTTLGYQSDASWMDQWNILVAAET